MPRLLTSKDQIMKKQVRLQLMLFFWGTLSFGAYAQVQIGGDIDGEASGDRSGSGVSLSADGSVLAIGALNNSNGNGRYSGHVRVYKRDASDNWVQLGDDIDGEASNDFSGGSSMSLSSDGRVLAIGARYNNNGNGHFSGHVRVYKRDASDNWVQLGDDIDGEKASDLSGDVSLSADGNVLAIGARYNDNGNGPDSGHVRVYKRDASDNWVQQGGDIDGEASGDRSGRGVSLSADGCVLAIGAINNSNGNGDDSGHVRVYERDASDDWVQLGDDIDGEKASDLSGGSVSLSTDGSVLAIGATGNDENGDRSGHVRVYKKIVDAQSPSGFTWEQLGEDIDGEAAGDRSGASVSLSADGSMLAIGAPGNGLNPDLPGHTRVYHVGVSGVSIQGAPAAVHATNSFGVTFTFDRGVTDFTASDINVSNATVGDLTGSGSAYTATIAPDISICGDITINVPAGSALDMDSNLPNFAAQQVTVEVVDDHDVNVVTVVGYASKNIYGPGGHLVIPERVQGTQDRSYEVRNIGNDAFFKHLFQGPKLTSVEMPSTLRRIGERAFWSNSLTEVDIPDGVTHIAKEAFYNNQLTSVKIPESLWEIKRIAFGNNQLTSVTMPSSGNLHTIERWAFYNNQLTEVIIPHNVRTVGLYTFQNNPGLRLVKVEAADPPFLQRDGFANANRDQIDLVVPMGDVRIQTYLDHGWHGFRTITFGIFTTDGIKYGVTAPTEVMVLDYTGTATEVIIPEKINNGSETYAVTAIGEDAFEEKGLTSVGIPVSVTSIGQRAFGDNQLTEVTLPDSVESIGELAFYNNPNLSLVTVGANNPPVLNAVAFGNANRHQIDLVVPTGKAKEYLGNGWDGFRVILDGSTLPFPTIDAPQSVDDLDPFTVNITFDGEVTGFEVDDIQVANATVSTLTGSGSTYAATLVPTSLCEDITIDVPYNVAASLGRLPNMAATQVIVAIDSTITCTDTGVVKLSSSPLIPTAFTPNGDGANDRWIIDNLSKDASVKIYDRHGTILFSSDNGYTRPWDGTSRGNLLPAGPYLYVIQNEQHTYKGTVTILL